MYVLNALPAAPYAQEVVTLNVQAALLEIISNQLLLQQPVRLRVPPLGYYEDSSTNTCPPCSSSCTVCTGSSNTECSKLFFWTFSTTISKCPLFALLHVQLDCMRTRLPMFALLAPLAALPVSTAPLYNALRVLLDTTYLKMLNFAHFVLMDAILAAVSSAMSVTQEI